MSIVQLTDKVFAVQVPDDAQDCQVEVFAEDNFYQFNYTTTINDEDSGFYSEYMQYDIDLPPGTWQYLFTTKGATEEEVAQVVEKIIHPNEPVYYKICDDESEAIATTDWKYAFGTLLTAKGCDTSKNHALIQKQL